MHSRLKTLSGFRERPVELVERALKNNLYDVIAVADGEVIGMGRLVGDGVMYWYLQEIVVLPDEPLPPSPGSKNTRWLYVQRVLQKASETVSN